MVTQRLSVSPRQEIGTTLGEDKLFDLDGIEAQQKSEAIGQGVFLRDMAKFSTIHAELDRPMTS